MKRSGLADICYIDIITLKNALGAHGPATIDNILGFFPCNVEIDIQGNMITSIIEVKNAALPSDHPQSPTYSITNEIDHYSNITDTDAYSLHSSDNEDKSDKEMKLNQPRKMKILIQKKKRIPIQK